MGALRRAATLLLGLLAATLASSTDVTFLKQFGGMYIVHALDEGMHDIYVHPACRWTKLRF